MFFCVEHLSSMLSVLFSVVRFLYSAEHSSSLPSTLSTMAIFFVLFRVYFRREEILFGREETT